MDVESLSFCVGVIGNIISVLVFLSPVGTFRRIIKHKSTEDFQSLPYICTLLSSSLWTYYGIIKPGGYLIATVNGFGILVEAIYVTLFLIYSPTKAIRDKTAAIFGILDVGFLAAAILVTRLALEGETRIDAIGFICAGLNVIMYASPLSAMHKAPPLPRKRLADLNPIRHFYSSQDISFMGKTVVTTKSVEYMPFFLSFFLFLNGGTWAFYALLVRDIFLGVPNGTGFLLGTAQLILYAIYGNAKQSSSSSSMSVLNALEEGTQHQPLMASSSSSSAPSC